VLETYRRAADLAADREFERAIPLFRQIVDNNPTMADVWQQLGTLLVRAGRTEEAVVALKAVVGLRPGDASALLSVASALFKLRQFDDARAHAELAERAAEDESAQVRAGVQEMLVKLALARKDGAAALRHANLAQQADPTLPMPLYVQGRLLHEAGRYAEALPLFVRARDEMRKRTLTLGELHFYLGDTLARLDRPKEAEAELLEEVRLFPQNSRARASLAMLYRSTGQDRAAEQAIDNLLRALPTPEGYDTAAQLWRMFGEPERAAAVQSRARDLFRQPAARESGSS
jgi:superkiller protein 3